MSPTLYVRRGGQWVIPTVADEPSADGRLTRTQREALVPTEASYDVQSTFGVATEDKTGLYPGYGLTAAPGVTPLTVQLGTNGSFQAQAGVTYENTVFWCQYVPARGGGAPSHLRNCWVAGVDPDTIPSATKTATDGVSRTYNYAADTSPVRAIDVNVNKGWTITDSVIDPGAWFTSAAPGGARSGPKELKLRSTLGVRGGHGTVARTRFRNMQDMAHLVGGTTDAADGTHMKYLGCLMSDGIFYQTDTITGPNDHWQAEGTHSDLLQFHYIINCVVRGNMFYVPYNAAIMLQRESSTFLFQNILIKGNVFERDPRTEIFSEFGINHAPKNDNGHPDVLIDSNLFVTRTDGRYIWRPDRYASKYTNNRRIQWVVPGQTYTDLGAVPITSSGA